MPTYLERKAPLVLLAGLGLSLILVGCFGGGSSSTSPTPTGCSDTPQQQVADLINLERNDAGLPALEVELRIVEAAQRHATDMAANFFMNHQGSDGSLPTDRLADAGYPYTDVGENIAMGQPTAAEAVSDWMNSTQGHREMILGVNFAHLAVGHATSGFNPIVHFWVVDFGSCSDKGQVPDDGCHP
jgi:uncharacterized protein YkwD